MNPQDPSPTDNYAIFEAEVKAHFHFLEQQFGFRLSQIKHDGFIKSIRFESPSVYVNAYYGPRTNEIEISFGRIGIDGFPPHARSFDPGDLMLLNNGPNDKWTSGVTYSNRLVRSIAGFARFLQEYGADCLKGEQAVYEAMKRHRDMRHQIWLQEEGANYTRRNIKLAWEKKDYTRVIALLESLSVPLTAVETKKLAYAKKHA